MLDVDSSPLAGSLRAPSSSSSGLHPRTRGPERGSWQTRLPPPPASGGGGGGHKGPGAGGRPGPAAGASARRLPPLVAGNLLVSVEGPQEGARRVWGTARRLERSGGRCPWSCGGQGGGPPSGEGSVTGKPRRPQFTNPTACLCVSRGESLIFIPKRKRFFFHIWFVYYININLYIYICIQLYIIFLVLSHFLGREEVPSCIEL